MKTDKLQKELLKVVEEFGTKTAETVADMLIEMMQNGHIVNIERAATYVKAIRLTLKGN